MVPPTDISSSRRRATGDVDEDVTPGHIVRRPYDGYNLSPYDEQAYPEEPWFIVHVHTDSYDEWVDTVGIIISHRGVERDRVIKVEHITSYRSKASI